MPPPPRSSRATPETQSYTEQQAGRYVGPETLRVRARVRWFDPGTVVNAVWRVRIDQAVRELMPDCNGNGVPDGEDIASGTSEDGNFNDVPDECECLADVTGDGRVDSADVLDVLRAWGECPGRWR